MNADSYVLAAALVALITTGLTVAAVFIGDGNLRDHFNRTHGGTR